MTSYKLEKRVWSEADFNEMGWHDTTVWSTSADPERFEYLVDLDYIFGWVKPEPDQTYFKFWVAPVTMVFVNAHSVKIDIESDQGTIEVADFHMEDPRPTPNGKFIQNTFRFECQEGSLSLSATGYQMHVRHDPALLEVQSLSLAQRDGVSFARFSE